MNSKAAKLLCAIALMLAGISAANASAIDDLQSSAGETIKSHHAVVPAPAPANSDSSATDAAAASTSEHLVMGNPSNAGTTDNNNYLLVRPQYVVSYNSSKGTPNWVAWHLNSTWIGSVKRSDDFRADTSLPSGLQQITPDVYKDSGFDKGHMCNSEDRTNTVENNQATFLMSNMIPQSPKNNEQTWGSLEEYSRTLAKAGDELYIYSGPWGQGGEGSKGQSSTLSSGGLTVTVPQYTWKVVLVLPGGSTSPSAVTSSAKAIAVIMPNTQEINTDWKTYIVTVSDVENMTGYTFFTNVSSSVASSLKQQKYSAN
jgi:endonuclease G